MKKMFVSLFSMLALLLSLPLTASAGGNTFDPATSILTMPLVKTPAATYADLEVKIIDYQVIKAKKVIEVDTEPKEPIFDGSPGGIGILPNGHTCFLGFTPGCEANPAWDDFNPFTDWNPEPEPGPGFSPPKRD